MRCFLVIILLFLSVCTDSYAQSYSGQASGHFIVYSIQSLTVTAKGGVIGFNTPNDYFNGVVSEHYANLQVKSNANWIVMFSAQSAHFTPLSRHASSDMPCSVMGVRVNGSGNFKTLTTQSQKLQEGHRGSSSNQHNFDIDVNFTPGFSYSGGLYSIGIVYTLTKK